jgi:GDP-L-fucose synthase
MKFVEAKKNNAKQVVIWGTGTPVREWLHVDDGAEAMIRGINVASISEPINIGVGKGISIYDMATLIKDYVGFNGEMVFDTSKPDGAPYKTVDGSKGQELYNWVPSIDFLDGVKETIRWYNLNRIIK